MAIWDDHDYGSNDIGADNPIKYESQSIFLEFWRIPTASERRRQSGGVYGSYRFNTPSGQGSVSIIMPDLRFFREPLQLCEHREYYPRQGCYCPANRSLIGDVQWAWLEDVVSKSQRSDVLTIIASSTQFGHSANGYESWTNFPLDRARLHALLDPSKSLVISGDAHWGEISMVNGLINATSSGFSEFDTNVLPNQNRVGSAVAQLNYGLINLADRTVSIYGLGHTLQISVTLAQ
jgi:alkaline phosphatase D